MNVSDPDEILALKQQAVSALQNYLLYDSACNDPKLRAAMRYVMHGLYLIASDEFVHNTNIVSRSRL